MLSWFNRNVPKPSLSHTDDAEQQQPHTAVSPPVVPEAGSRDPTHLTVAQPALGTPLVATTLTPEPQQRKETFTAALSTPHDAVLAELHGHGHPGPDPSARADATPSPSAPGTGMQSLDTLPAAASDALDSVPTSPTSHPDALYEPFTGATIGFLSPTAKKVNEDLWAHLSRIRSLQADVARLHLTMEGIGLDAESAVPPLLRSTGPRAVGERLEDDEENSEGDGGSEAERRRARELERSERMFDGRKEEIGQVMAKVCMMRLLDLQSIILMWDCTVSWTSSRRHSRRFMRSVRQCSVLREPPRVPRS